MATSSNWLYLSPILAGGLRALVGTPLDAVATREILLGKNTFQVMKGMSARDYFRGLQPNGAKFMFRTPMQFAAVRLSSLVVPTQLDAAVRGVCFGVLTGAFETVVFNGCNSLRTRFILGSGWNVLRTEGPSVLTKGLSAAFAHRAFSWAIFLAIYEKLRENYPSHGFAVSTASGAIQVISTAPFYIAAIEKQREKATAERLHRTLLRLMKTRGLIGGLFLPALAPRLIHSAITSAPLLWLMEKLQLIHR